MEQRQRETKQFLELLLDLVNGRSSIIGPVNASALVQPLPGLHRGHLQLVVDLELKKVSRRKG